MNPAPAPPTLNTALAVADTSWLSAPATIVWSSVDVNGTDESPRYWLFAAVNCHPQFPPELDAAALVVRGMPPQARIWEAVRVPGKRPTPSTITVPTSPIVLLQIEMFGADVLPPVAVKVKTCGVVVAVKSEEY